MSRNPAPDIFDRLVSLRLPAELEDKLRALATEQGKNHDAQIVERRGGERRNTCPTRTL